MTYKKVLVTGSCGLVGSETVSFYCGHGATVIGLDNDRRGEWFGEEGSITPVLMQLDKVKNYKHNNFSIINRMALNHLVKLTRPDLVIHCAAQPSHDLSGKIPFEDFMVNTAGTVNLLESVREYCPESPFIFVSTNKVYGDKPNQIKLKKENNRYVYDEDGFLQGVDEKMSIDQSMHTPFGCSKTAADLMVQEYGRYYGMTTVCFRCGCVTGEQHRGVELHGFLSHLCKTAKAGKKYTIFGHEGFQVRDNIHVFDLIRAFDEWARSPKTAEVYNIGGGIHNSCSINQAIVAIKHISGIELEVTHGKERKGDHLCYYTNFQKFSKDYPRWGISRNLQSIFESLVG